MPRRPRTGYRLITMCVRTLELAEADRIAAALRDAGWPQSNRSLVGREAFSCLSDAVRGKSIAEIFEFFAHRQSRRAQRSVRLPSAA